MTVLGDMKMVLLAASLAGMPLCLDARAETSELQFLISANAHNDYPNLGWDVQFEVREYDVPGLWEHLQMQLFLAEYKAGDGTSFNSSLFFYNKGRITPFGGTFGGHGLMSAVLYDGKLYYSYSWGSGVHRSHIGTIAPVKNTFSVSESSGYEGIDLFVSVKDHVLTVERGTYVAYNVWSRIGSSRTFEQVWRGDLGGLADDP